MTTGQPGNAQAGRGDSEKACERDGHEWVHVGFFINANDFLVAHRFECDTCGMVRAAPMFFQGVHKSQCDPNANFYPRGLAAE